MMICALKCTHNSLLQFVRYVDIIIQRLLTAVLDNESSPYTGEKLDQLVNHLNSEQGGTQKWKMFKTHVNEIHLAYQVKEGSQGIFGYYCVW